MAKTNPFANMTLNVIQYPVGTYGFVGSVPAVLAYASDDAELLAIAAQSGPGLARSIAAREGKTFKTCTWATRADAIAAAAAAGFTVANA